MQILKQEEQTATTMITDQLWQGKDSKGKSLPEYSPASILYFGKPAGSWRLFETGQFYGSVFMQVEKDRAIFDSSDSKRDDIFTKLEIKGHNSDDVLNLSKENVSELAQTRLREKTVQYFRQMLAV